MAILLLVAFATGSAGNDSVLMEGRQRSEAFLSRDLDGIWHAMTPEMRGALGSLGALRQFRGELERMYGSQDKILHEDVRRKNGHDIYRRTARWTKAASPLVIQWVFNDESRIAGFFVQPVPAPADSRFLDYRTKAALRLPFDGEWYVFWGGRTLEQNYHATNKAQRFALDFVVRDNGSNHSGNAADLSSYYCWNRPILAPAAGTVVTAIGNLPDQPISSRDPSHPAGNHVVLDLGHSEFAFLAHLKQGSVTVKPGDTVSPGEEIGRCGNSGNTSEPHLHFHLQTMPDLRLGEGLPAYFENYRADGERVERGQPLQGQTVSPIGAG